MTLFFLRSKQHAGDADQRLLNIPGRRDVFEGEFKVTAFARSKRRCLRREHGAGFAQNDLAKFVGEFNSELDVREREITRIREATPKSGDFLIQKIFGASESQVFNLKLWCVGLFGGSKRKMRFARAVPGHITITSAMAIVAAPIHAIQERPVFGSG